VSAVVFLRLLCARHAEVQRDLWVSFWISDSPSQLPTPHVITCLVQVDVQKFSAPWTPLWSIVPNNLSLSLSLFLSVPLSLSRHKAKRRVGYSTRRHMLGHERPEAVSPGRGVVLTDLQSLLIVNKLLSLSLSLSLSLPLSAVFHNSALTC
jgi:hypothetical protein